jgi:hypothetical protein
LFNMKDEKALVQTHPKGEVQTIGNQPSETVTSLDTFAGKIYVKWSPEATVSSLGLMPFFIEFLKMSGLFDKWVEDCPLHYTSGNAPEKRDVLGTLVLSVLAGHWRYAHINAIRGDGINPELLGMTKVASEDSVRRSMKAMDEAASGQWLKRHLKASYEPLLEEPWVLDVDTTVKPLYGHQQDAKVGYNPTKPGRSVARLSQLLRGKYPDGVGHGGAGGKSDSSVICATGTVGIPGRTTGAEPAGILAWGQPLGSGEGHGWSRGARAWIPVQAQAERECEEADRTNLPETGLGGGRTKMARQRGRVAVERVE